MATDSRSIRLLAQRLTDVERKVRAQGSTGQLAHSSIESGALEAYEGESHTMTIGRQFDGTYTSAVINGPIPPTPTAPIGTNGTEGGSVRWDGGWLNGGVVPMDYLRVDIHLSQVDGFTAAFENRYGTIVPPTGGEVAFSLAPGTWYAVLVVWTQAGMYAVSAQTSFESVPVAVTTDGLVPTTSPDVELTGGLDILYAKWGAVTNADPVTYEVHIGESSAFVTDTDPAWISGTDPDTLVGLTDATSFVIKHLPGPAPAVGEDDPRTLLYDTFYYVKIVARDADGRAILDGAEDSAEVFQVTGANIAANTIIGQNILGGTITGDLLSSTMVISSEFWTALDGQRAGFTPQGFFAYKPDNSLMLKIPTDPSQGDAVLDAIIIARGLTATGAVTMRANNNAVEKDGVVVLRNGIASPSAIPQMETNYSTVQLTTAGLTDAQKTGTLGTFDFDANQASCLEYKQSGSYWVVHQVRPNGTRAWFFDYDGTPITAGGLYFTDYKDWEIWSVIEMTASPGKNGVYRMQRWIPAGTANTYYIQSPFGLNRYSRQNGTVPPALATNGVDIAAVEVIAGQLNLRYISTFSGDQTNAIITTVYQSASGFTTGHPIATVWYDSAGFDIGSPRYLVTERGFPVDHKLVYTSGTNANSIFPGGAASWTATDKDEETFETAHANPRASAWDGSNFWLLGGDGVLYQYTTEHWDKGNAATPSTIWAQHTFYDSVGTTHETTPGPAKSFVWKRRSNVMFFNPPIPGAGGADEPNQVSTYVGRGTTQPSNANMRLQIRTSSTTTILDGFDFLAGANPPAVNGFPLTNPAKVQSDDGHLVISGDGKIKFGTIDVEGMLLNLGTGVAVHKRETSGTASFAKPAGARLHWVRCWGPAGAGGGVASGTGQAEGGGGGAGAYVDKWYLDSELSASESYTVGAGGTGVSGAAGNPGSGATTFKGLSAGAGGGGTAMTPSTATSQAAACGAGGTASGGDTNINGGDGGMGRTVSGVAIFANFGGACPQGGPSISQRDFGQSAGNAGIFPGGGGTGAFGGGTAFAGGAGAAGRIMIISFF